MMIEIPTKEKATKPILHSVLFQIDYTFLCGGLALKSIATYPVLQCVQ